MKKNVILITGSSSGIGRETAFRFAKAGYSVVLTYCKGKKNGEAAGKECIKLGAPEALTLHLDVTDGKSIREALRKVRASFGGVDVLVNNAGTGVWKLFKDQTVKDIEKQLRTNLEGAVKVTSAFLPFTGKAIVNIASYLGKHASGEYAVYCASKFGLRGFTQSIAAEHPKLKIFCVNPDLTSTRLTGYQGRPPSAVADVIFKGVTGEMKVERGGDIDMWEVKPVR